MLDFNLKAVFGFAGCQDKGTYGLGFNLTFQKNSGSHVLSHRAGAIDTGRVFIDDISLHVPHYTPNKSNEKLMLRHIVSKAATEISY